MKIDVPEVCWRTPPRITVPINSEIHPFNIFAVTILSIAVGYAGEVEHVDIAVETVNSFGVSFTWTPPLSIEPRDADNLLAGPESILPDDVAAEVAALEELKRIEGVQSIDEVEVLEEKTLDFDEFD
ncbi:uncharacterized protein F5891DRAFT_1195257 [Suillus fuscotomentosus]|uniref:Uncharacterized protein n=1 Tax=Suillus fuscotomentosus TaxID=1912939 RepID=A0AAD4DV49_9AGAM|nr:uncharacterized protein F5891DRAFT_1195257 [Suillus fuscotomentosus]KAG1894414.1 hypothetical protein F5891DRAFT_1195257 [Suillus fuscotomentosus]